MLDVSPNKAFSPASKSAVASPGESSLPASPNCLQHASSQLITANAAQSGDAPLVGVLSDTQLRTLVEMCNEEVNLSNLKDEMRSLLEKVCDQFFENQSEGRDGVEAARNVDDEEQSRFADPEADDSFNGEYLDATQR